MKLKQTLSHMLSMNKDAWYIFIRSIQLCCVLLVCSFALLLEWNGSMLENYSLYMTAISLQETSQAILLIGGIFSVCVESIYS